MTKNWLEYDQKNTNNSMLYGLCSSKVSQSTMSTRVSQSILSTQSNCFIWLSGFLFLGPPNSVDNLDIMFFQCIKDLILDRIAFIIYEQSFRVEVLRKAGRDLKVAKFVLHN